MIKRLFAAMPLALALFAINSARPADVAASDSLSEESTASSDCVLMWCVSHNTHHIVCTNPE